MIKTVRSAERRTRPANRETPRYGSWSNGLSMTPDEFDLGDFEEGYRYELVRGVLIVCPPPLEEERDPNEELGYLLRLYHETHPQGKALDKTLSEHDVRTGANRRRADRVIWAGLGRMPRRREMPTIVVEFVSAGRRCQERDYVEKRDEYLSCGIREYWIIDRFLHKMTVYAAHGARFKKRALLRRQSYQTPLLPGFELPLTRLFALSDSWAGDA